LILGNLHVCGRTLFSCFIIDIRLNCCIDGDSNGVFGFDFTGEALFELGWDTDTRLMELPWRDFFLSDKKLFDFLNSISSFWFSFCKKRYTEKFCF
jgi:hypothetical protein